MWSSFSCFLRQSFTKYVLDFSLAFGPLRKERRHRYKWGEEKKLLQTIDTVAGQVDSWRLVPRPANLVFCYLEPLFQFFELFAGDGAIGLDSQLAGPNGRFTPPQFPLLLLKTSRRGGIRLDFHRRQFARADAVVAITAGRGQSRPARLLHFHLRFHWQIILVHKKQSWNWLQYSLVWLHALYNKNNILIKRLDCSIQARCK